MGIWNCISKKIKNNLPAGRGYIDKKLELMKRFFISKNIPLIIGEFGSEDKGNTSEREKWASYMVSEAKKLGITCFVWDNGGKFNMGLVDRYGLADPFPTIIKSITGAFT